MIIFQVVKLLLMFVFDMLYQFHQMIDVDYQEEIVNDYEDIDMIIMMMLTIGDGNELTYVHINGTFMDEHTIGMIGKKIMMNF